MKQSIIAKFTSRKFWASAIGVILGIALTFGVDGDQVTEVAGAVTALLSIVTYVYTEGKVDAAAVGKAVELIEKGEDGEKE